MLCPLSFSNRKVWIYFKLTHLDTKIRNVKENPSRTYFYCIVPSLRNKDFWYTKQHEVDTRQEPRTLVVLYKTHKVLEQNKIFSPRSADCHRYTHGSRQSRTGTLQRRSSWAETWGRTSSGRRTDEDLPCPSCRLGRPASTRPTVTDG